MVTLRNGSGVILATNMTDATGAYCFYNLSAGTYAVSNAIAGYTQTGGTCTNHWTDSQGRDCWNDLDHYTHYNNLGTNCWVASDGCTHWQDKATGLDTWKDSFGKLHTQPCCQSCGNITGTSAITVVLSACQNKTGVNFAEAGTSGKINCSVKGPISCKRGNTITYTCSVTNTGNLCFSQGCKVYIFGGYITCPSLPPGGTYSFTTNYTTKWSDPSLLSCSVAAYGYPPSGTAVTATSSCSTMLQ